MEAKQRRNQGGAILEYLVLIGGTIIFGIVLFWPFPGNPLYDVEQSLFRRLIVVIGLPVL